MDLDLAYFSMRPVMFDMAGLLLIISVILYLAYIRYDFPWMAKFAFWGFIVGGAPLLFFILSGYTGQ